MSRIAESTIYSEQLAPIAPIHTAAPRHTNLLHPSHCIAGSDIHASCREAADMGPRDTIGEPDVRNKLLHAELHVTLPNQARFIITLDQYEHQTAVRE